MNTYTFKTNINCSGCVDKVKPSLDSENSIENWSVDTDNKDKILTVSGELSKEKVEEIVTKSGFKITEACFKG